MKYNARVSMGFEPNSSLHALSPHDANQLQSRCWGETLMYMQRAQADREHWFLSRHSYWFRHGNRELQ